MKLIKLMLLTLGLGLSLSAGAIEVGQPATAFAAPELGSANKIKLSDFKGKVVVVEFWSSWCTTCKKVFPQFNELQKVYGPKGLQIISINSDIAEKDAKRFLKKTPAEFYVLYDQRSDILKSWVPEKPVLPTTVVIDRNGVVQWLHDQISPEEVSELEAKVKSLL